MPQTLTQLNETEVPVTSVLPPQVEGALAKLGIAPDGDVLVQARSDLNADGRWGERYLVATADRVLVLRREGDDPENGAISRRIGAAKNGAATNGVAKNDAELVLDLDIPLRDIISTEAKTLVGSAAIEARVREYSQEGATSNGAAANGAASNGASGNGAAFRETVNGTASTRERVVELIRSSNAHSRELDGAARRLEKLRENGEVEAALDEAKEARAICARCGRAFPHDTNVCPFCVNKWQAIKRLLGYLKDYKWMAIGNGVLSIGGTALSFVPIILVQPLVNNVFRSGAPTTPREYSQLSWIVLAMLGSALATTVISMVRGRSIAYLGADVLHDIRAQLFAHLQRLSLAYYDKREVGSVMSRVQNDVQMLQNFLLDAAESLIISTLTILIVVIIMLKISPLLTLAVLLPVPFVVVGTNLYWRGLIKLWRRVQHQNATLGARLADTLGGVRVVRAFAQEDREVALFYGKSGELRDATMNVEKRAALFNPAIGFIMGLGLPIAWLVGGRQALDGVTNFGALLVFVGLLQRLYEPVQQLTRLVNFTTRAMTAAERVFEVLDTEPEVRQSKDAVPMKRVEGHVEFRDVVFGYDKHRPVLKGISLDVAPGEMIGLVGHSGAGKSTLINLLMRFYDVDEGAITIDGVDLRRIDREDVRSQIGIVLQEPYLFHGSVWENIAYGKPSASPDEIMFAAKAAYAHDFIVSFPDGYDTLVGERGTRLSGGERQRISIARAILHDPRILILDEATASVDTQTEQQIQSALKNLVQGRTTFAIAHRLSTLRNANRLVVLDGGKIVEIGTHDELMEQHGTFYKLVNAQKAMNEVAASAVGG